MEAEQRQQDGTQACNHGRVHARQKTYHCEMDRQISMPVGRNEWETNRSQIENREHSEPGERSGRFFQEGEQWRSRFAVRHEVKLLVKEQANQDKAEKANNDAPVHISEWDIRVRRRFHDELSYRDSVLFREPRKSFGGRRDVS